MTFIGSRKDVVGFARDLLLISEPDLQWIMIMPAGLSEVYYVSIAINTSLEGTAKTMAHNYSLKLTNTSPTITLDGSCHQR